MVYIDITELSAALKKRYGDLDNDRGCYVNGEWLSLARISDMLCDCMKTGDIKED